MLGNTSLHANRTLLKTPTLNIAMASGVWTGTVDAANNDIDIQNAGFNGLVQTTGQIASAFKSGPGQEPVSPQPPETTPRPYRPGVILNNNAGAVLYSSGTARLIRRHQPRP